MCHFCSTSRYALLTGAHPYMGEEQRTSETLLCWGSVLAWKECSCCWRQRRQIRSVEGGAGVGETFVAPLTSVVRVPQLEKFSEAAGIPSKRHNAPGSQSAHAPWNEWMGDARRVAFAYLAFISMALALETVSRWVVLNGMRIMYHAAFLVPASQL